MRTFSRVKVWLAAISAVLLLVGGGAACAPVHPYFRLTQKDYVVRPGSLVVLAGDRSQVSLRLARSLSAFLQNSTVFRVIPHEEVIRRNPDYPLVFVERRTWRNFDGDLVTSYTEPTSVRIQSIRKDLNADYVFVVWGGEVTKDMPLVGGAGMYSLPIPVGSVFHVEVGGRLYEGDRAVVGRSSFTESVGGGFANSDKDSKFTEQLLDNAAAAIAEDVLSFTRKAKTFSRQGT